MDTSWTPGPWRVAGRMGGGVLIDAPAENADIAVAYGPGVTIAGDANARLIAAAPALYEALAECRTDLMIAAGNADHAARTDPRWEGVGEKLRERVRQADAALAAAHGKEG